MRRASAGLAAPNGSDCLDRARGSLQAYSASPDDVLEPWRVVEALRDLAPIEQFLAIVHRLVSEGQG